MTCQGLLRQYGIDFNPASALQGVQFNMMPPMSTAGTVANQPAAAAGVGSSDSPGLAARAQAHVCDRCGKVFTGKSFLDKHLKRRHGCVAPSSPPPAAQATPAPPQVGTGEDDINQGARRLSEMVARKREEELRVLKEENERLRELARGPQEEVPVEKGGGELTDAQRKRERRGRVLKLLKFRRVFNMFGPQRLQRNAFNRWRALLAVRPKPASPSPVRSVAVSTAPAPDPLPVRQPPPARKPRMTAKEMLDALQRRVDLAVEAQFGPRPTAAAASAGTSTVMDHHVVELPSGHQLESHWRLDPVEVEEMRRSVVDEMMSSGAALGIDMGQKKLQDETYSRKLADLAIRRDQTLGSKVQAALPGVQQTAQALTDQYYESLAGRRGMGGYFSALGASTLASYPHGGALKSSSEELESIAQRMQRLSGGEAGSGAGSLGIVGGKQLERAKAGKGQD
ncbi:unnamed protein product [Chrysoparadoxa australica]